MPFRIVLDTNILLRGLINSRSAAGAVLYACDQRRVVILLSRSLLREYKQILTETLIVDRYPKLTAEKVQAALRHLRFVSDVIDPVKCRFDFPRDPKDAQLVELAIAGNATHIVTGDRDLHWLAAGHGDAAKRFRQRAPSVRIVDAGSFLNAIEDASGKL
jgi:putative PIN family toxin of toxin-antitoxin system